ncbi:acetyl-CoA acetyltransferase [Sphaerisporangium krabiense]|uniref:Acetyl-CoA C-acetyltransferase n=1 Tax=Sphaerisporangium krabiense TaxID=763782 RepID=A0A7W8Z6Z3_9ACTN|nr:acetyl-CoA C-acyltransferase [Sphaerisporangium krabiense]MBB5628606.1 acetyl-CoA C-acetyltransferase [Sphaerisporangium krabiense]GII60558.1 acetyl-CoA acetyltransferase [Sphaerisporangium krabiense]
MTEAYIIGAVRTPAGRRDGGLAKAHPADLGALVVRALIDRTGADPSAVDEIVLGCDDAAGPQGGNLARTCWLAAGMPPEVPGVTLDRRGGSSQQAVHAAARAVWSGSAGLVVAGGVRSTSMVPPSEADPVAGSRGWRARYGGRAFPQLRTAETIAGKWDVSRREMEEFAVRSHRRAARALAEWRFEREVVPAAGLLTDEGPRPDLGLAELAALEPCAEGGRLTAALTAEPCDGAAAVLIASADAVRAHRLSPRARVHHASARACDPAAPPAFAAATARALDRTGMAADRLDVVEADEAYACLPLAWARETGVDPERINPNGGALALGDALGASGARALTSLLHELERAGGRYGLQVAEDGFQAEITIIERL